MIRFLLDFRKLISQFHLSLMRKPIVLLKIQLIALPSVPTFALLDSFIKVSSQGQTAFSGTDSIVSCKHHHNCIGISIV